jgi:hypothetical protein
VVPGTGLHIVYTEEHEFPERYTVRKGGLGFRVARNYPDAAPEDNFFITPSTIQLAAPDPQRNSTSIHRASASQGLLPRSVFDGGEVLIFSWHLWDRFGWRPRTHTLVDHYTHCTRRLEQPEHD